MIRTILMAILLAAVALAADVTGKWIASVPGRDGNTREVPYDFKVDGSKLTGTVGGMQGRTMEIMDGKVSGDELSFRTEAEFNGNKVTMKYKGKVMGDEIKFTQEREGGQPREFVAKRVKAS